MPAVATAAVPALAAPPHAAPGSPRPDRHPLVDRGRRGDHHRYLLDLQPGLGATATQTAVFVRQLAPQITQRYRGDYTGISAESVIGSGFVPANWTEGDDKIEDPEARFYQNWH